MRGTIAKKGGAYYVVHDVYEDGRRKRKWTRAGRTRAEADDKLSEVMGQVKSGVYVDTARTTVAEYLTDTWLPAIRATIKPSTAELYATIVDTYITPHIGGVRLQDVKPPHLNAIYATLATSGGRNGRPLSAKTIRNAHTLLHRAFRDGVRWDLLARNPAESADPPRVATPEITAWDSESVRFFLDHCKSDRLAPLWHLIATTGLRRGEALALRWSDVDLKAARVSVSRTVAWVGGRVSFQEPKTARVAACRAASGRDDRSAARVAEASSRRAARCR